MSTWCRHVHVRLHCFILTEACSCRLELAYLSGKISKNRLVCKNAVALAYYGSCRLLAGDGLLSAAIRFPHIETVVFSDQEVSSRWTAGLWNKIYLNPILKGSFLRVKTFQPITTVVNKDNKSFQFSNVPHIGFLWHLDSGEILLKGKLKINQLKINKYTTSWSFGRFCWLSQLEVW